MLGFSARLHPPNALPSITSTPPKPLKSRSSTPKSPPHKTLPRNNPRKFAVRAENGNGNGGIATNAKEEKEAKKNGGDGEEDPRRNGQPRFNLRWVDLVVDRDPDNILAVGLTGILTWASVQVLWQLLLISVAIVVAALKYSFIAALLIFILVTLL
ncbi:uncharacterized protein LOC127806604 [Diospyros lotus]|uniref:uncharacterized protein LOC127806604 n=1 Tax=Diospyros lotus TaxID=55363 RepID=UPI00225AB5B6|nr:uncharacterized protein LOC127806604 [Diospyros lotus]